MAKSISSTEKKSRGRPRTNPVAQHMTMPPDLSASLDRWAQQQKPVLSRPEAIRKILTDYLKRKALL